MALEKTTDILEHNKRREAEAVSRKATTANGKSEGEWLFKLPFAGRGMSNVRLSTGEIANFAVSVMALDPAPGDLVLDLGAGSCWVSEWLNRLLVDTVSLDYAHDMLAIGLERLGPGAKLTAGDFEKLPFVDNTFDGAICLSALHHVPDIPAALREIRRVLKPDGAAVFSEPGAGHSAHPQSRAERDELGVLERDIVVDELLDECLAAGFRTVYVLPNIFPPPLYDYQTWLSVERATAMTGVPGASVRQALRALVQAAWSLGRTEVNRLAEILPMPARTGHTNTPSVRSDVLLGWQSLLTFRNAVRGHPLVIARKAARVPDSRRPSVLNAEIATAGVSGPVLHGATFTIQAQVKNTGDTLWLHTPSPLGGHVALGAKLMDSDGLAVIYDYGRGLMQVDIAPGGTASIDITLIAPSQPGHYQVKLDMVDECIVWFEHRGAQPVLTPLEIL